MAWIRLDDQIAHHPKFAKVGANASWLFVGCLGYAQRYLTDGFIPQEALSSLTHVKKPRLEANKLVAARLLEKVAGGFQVHDYLEYNASASEVKADREWDRFRKELYSQPDLVKSIKRRDDNRCRYCGVEVNWSDRRGPIGGQFDHVKPRGPNTLENIVVACRKCNCAKSNRTPEQAHMPLLELVPNQIGTESENKDRFSLRARASYPSHPIPSVNEEEEKNKQARNAAVRNHFTKKELEHAKRVRQIRFGCTHTDRCASVDACVRLIAGEVRTKLSEKQA